MMALNSFAELVPLTLYKIEGEYSKAAELIRINVGAELSSIDADPTSLSLAIANKELGSIYLFEND